MKPPPRPPVSLPQWLRAAFTQRLALKASSVLLAVVL